MEKILFISAHPGDNVKLESIISSAFRGVKILTATNGIEGLEKAIAFLPDVILMDDVLNDKSFIQVAEQIKNDQRICLIPIVLLSGKSESGKLIIRDNNATIDALIRKPVDRNELVLLLRAMLKVNKANQIIALKHEVLLPNKIEPDDHEQKRPVSEKALCHDLFLLNNSVHAQNKSWESDELFRNFFENHTAVKLIIDPDNGRIIDANNSAVQFYGWTKQQLLQMYIQQINTLSHEEVQQAMQNAASRQQTYFEFRHKLANGSIRDVEVYSSNIELNEKKLLYSIVHDITNRKIADEEISRNVARLRRAELAAKSGNWEMHLNSQMIYVSEGAKKIYGIEQEQNSYSTIKKYPLPQYRAKLDEALMKLINNEDNYNVEFEIKRLSDGEIVDIHSVASYNKEKGIVFGTIQDISEHKKLERALRESEAKFRSLFSQMSEGFALHELIYDEKQQVVDYRIVDVNPAFAKQVGMETKNPIGALASEFYGISPAPFLDIYAKVGQNGNRVSFSSFVESLDRYFNVSVFSPKQGMFATVFSDITESKRAEEKLIEEQKLNQTLIDNLPGIFYLYTYPEIELVRWNKNHETMLDLTREELKNRFVVEWPRPKVKEEMINAMHTVYREGFAQLETSFFRKSGGEIPLILSAVRLDIRGQTFIMGFGINITERKQAYEALRKSEAQLRELNATKDKFFSIIAHDLKSPFNSILGLSSLLVEQIQNNDFHDVGEYAGIIQNSTKKAMDLLLNLLEWSRAQTGRMEYNPEYIEFVSIINEVIELLIDSAQQKSIAIEKEMPAKIVAYADKAMISTVIRNLLSNAIKFTNKGGLIRICVEKKRKELKICVVDNGVGIAPEAIQKLFRFDENYTTMGTLNEKGTGLGLILCKEFVEKHNGHLGIISNNDQANGETGSTFYFTIPNVLN